MALYDKVKDYVKTFPATLPEACIGVSEDGTEVSVEWKLGYKCATILFDEDKTYGYAYFKGGKFIPGKEEAGFDKPLPQDLIDYILSEDIMPVKPSENPVITPRKKWWARKNK